VVEDVVVKKFTFAISSPDEFLVRGGGGGRREEFVGSQRHRRQSRRYRGWSIPNLSLCGVRVILECVPSTCVDGRDNIIMTSLLFSTRRTPGIARITNMDREEGCLKRYPCSWVVFTSRSPRRTIKIVRRILALEN